MVSNDETNAAMARLSGLIEDPETMAGLEHFMQRLPELNATLEILTGFLASSSRIADNANGIIGTAREAFGGVDAGEQVERLKGAMSTGTRIAEELGEPLSDPANLESMRQLVEMLPKLVSTMQILEQFLTSSSRFADNVNSIVMTAREAAEKHWPDLMDRQGLLDLPNQVHELITSHSLQQLLASRVLSDGALHVMDQVAAATVEAHAKSVNDDARLSRVGAFKSLGDPDVQRGLAFTVELARCLGAHIRVQPHATPSAEREAGSNGA